MNRVPTWIWALLGALTGIGVAVVVLATALRSHGEPVERVPRLLPETEGAMTEVALHYVPHLTGVVGETYADFLGALWYRSAGCGGS